MPEQPEIEQTIVNSPNGTKQDAPRPMLVEGSGPALSTAVDGVLRDRLKIASLLLFFGFTTFFIRKQFEPPEFEGFVGSLLHWSHLAVIVVSGLTAFRMCSNCQYALSHLRVMEGLLFGLPVLLFTIADSSCLLGQPLRAVAWPIAPKWIILIFTYALFIPNTWRRAAWPIGVMALLPVVASGLAESGITSHHEQHASLLMTHARPTELILVMAFTGITATWGVYAINTLRREAFEAKRLGQYQLSRLLGAGGMGEVYLAEHVLLKRPCAIKVIRPDRAGDADALARFEREVQATSRLTHWNTVEIFDYGRADDGTFYYVMEYLPGMNLDQLVSMHGPLPAERVIHLLTQVCDALREAHDSGLIHRDIKPANIFAAHRGGIFDVAKLLDFGLARPLSSVQDIGLTQEGSITGSPLFTSPEQAVGDPADERSDIYSLGAVAWWLLTGKPLFENENPLKILVAHATQSPGSLIDLAPDVPVELVNIVMQCLQKNPDDRFQSASDLRHALLSCDDAIQWTQPKATEWWSCHGCPEKKKLDAEVFAEPAAWKPSRNFDEPQVAGQQ